MNNGAIILSGPVSGIVRMLQHNQVPSDFGIQVACQWLQNLLASEGAPETPNPELYACLDITPEQVAGWQQAAREACRRRFERLMA